MLNRFYILSIFLLFSAGVSLAQKSKNWANLEREKKINLEKMNQVKKILVETQNDKQESLGQIRALNQQIENQEIKINLAQDEFGLLKQESVQLEQRQLQLWAKKKSVQKEYAETIYHAAKRSNQITKLGFLLSSGSINELFLRYKYLNQYTENRKHQLVQLKVLNTEILKKKLEIDDKKNKQQSVIIDISKQNKALAGLRNEQNGVLLNLTAKESELKEKYNTSKIAVDNLNALISRIINKKTLAKKTEAENNKSEVDKNASTEINTVKESTPKAVIRGTNFVNAKSRLPWPVDGFISDRFGIKPHPVLKGIKIDNNGVDIQTNNNATVNAVFDGTVLDISEITGLGYVVAVQHGEYYTVYANLSNVSVNINDKVQINQKLGNAGKKDGSYEINFQIWHNFDKLNPQAWLRAK